MTSTQIAWLVAALSWLCAALDHIRPFLGA